MTLNDGQLSKISVLLLSAILLLSGCMVQPKFIKPQAPIQETWGASGDSRIKEAPIDQVEWWKSFWVPLHGSSLKTT